MSSRILTALAMISALAYVMSLVSMVPVVLFLGYDPKDTIITIAGFIYGPVSAFLIALVVSVVQMFTTSVTGPWGLLMNVIGSASFCCTAAYIYKKNRSIKGAVFGLVVAIFISTIVMMLWNYLIVPLYMPGVTREAVMPLLMSIFLPFNLLSNSLNAAFTIILYKHVKAVLIAAKMMPAIAGQVSRTQSKQVLLAKQISPNQEKSEHHTKINIGLVMAAVFIAVSCVLGFLALSGVF